MSEIKDIKNMDDLINKIKNPDIRNAYHYTSLYALFMILSNKNLQFSSFQLMNDEFEKRLYGNCHDYFFCLSKSAISKENFGMWAMYGRLRSDNKIDCKEILQKEDCDYEEVSRQIGVKIYFPKKVLKNIMKTNNLELHSVVYAKLRENFGNEIKQRITIGSQTTMEEISVKIDELPGYFKDSAWAYENEIRLRASSTKDIMEDKKNIHLLDEDIAELKVYPSPYYEKKDIEELLKKLGYKGTVKIEENIYRNVYAGGRK